MKYTLLLSLTCIASIGFAQNAPIDFEPDGFGADWTWATFEAPAGEDNPTFSIEPNISVDATNPSATVAKMDISYASDQGWGQAGCESMHGADLGPFTVTSENSIVSMMIYQVGFASPVALKFATTEGAAFLETVVPNNVADQWVEVEFDMSVWIGSTLPGILDQIIFFPSYGPRATGHVVYFDNVVFGESDPPAGDPLTAAPDPTIDEEFVISIYSDYYTNNTVENFNFNAFQGGGNVSEVVIENNNTGKIEGLTFYGAEWTAVDVNEFDFVHITYWSSSSTAFNFYLIDQTAGIPGGSPAEPRFSFGGAGADAQIVQGAWVTVAIPLQHFLDFPSTGFDYDLDDIFQWKFDGNGTLFFDNIYFSKVVVSTNDLDAADFSVFPNPSQDFWNVNSAKGAITKVRVFNALGQMVWSATPNTNTARIDASVLKAGLYITQLETADGMITIKLVKE
jgi:hypothetical protein